MLQVISELCKNNKANSLVILMLSVIGWQIATIEETNKEIQTEVKTINDDIHTLKMDMNSGLYEVKLATKDKIAKLNTRVSLVEREIENGKN